LPSGQHFRKGEKRGVGRSKGQGLGVYSCSRVLFQLDKRSREYRLMRQIRKDLTEHVGGRPNPLQRMLIERAVVLSLRVAMIDQKIVAGEILTQMDNNQALAWNNALRRTLVSLGVQPAAAPAPSLNDVLSDIAARRAVSDLDDDDEAAA
jgi:hypothetical protein